MPPARRRTLGLSLATMAMLASMPLLGPVLPAVGPSSPTGAVTSRPVPTPDGSVDALACGSAADCWAVGSAQTALGPVPLIDATRDSGTAWVAEQPGISGSATLDAVACPDQRHCLAVGGTAGGAPAGVAMVTDGGGRRWQQVAAPGGAVDLSAVYCAQAGHCLVLATDGSGYWSASTVDGGQVWQRTGTLPLGFGGPTGVTCQGSTCVSAGYLSLTGAKGAGAVALTTDGGRSWTTADVPADVGPLHDAACPTAARCLAVGTSSPNLADVTPAPSVVLASADGGLTWTTTSAPSGVGNATGISCATATRCAAVGTAWTFTDPPTPVGAVATTTDGGLTWRAPASRRLPAGLAGVACPTTSACVAGGGDELAGVTLPQPRRRR